MGKIFLSCEFSDGTFSHHFSLKRDGSKYPPPPPPTGAACTHCACERSSLPANEFDGITRRGPLKLWTRGCEATDGRNADGYCAGGRTDIRAPRTKEAKKKVEHFVFKNPTPTFCSYLSGGWEGRETFGGGALYSQRLSGTPRPVYFLNKIFELHFYCKRERTPPSFPPLPVNTARHVDRSVQNLRIGLGGCCEKR